MCSVCACAGVTWPAQGWPGPRAHVQGRQQPPARAAAGAARRTLSISSSGLPGAAAASCLRAMQPAVQTLRPPGSQHASLPPGSPGQPRPTGCAMPAWQARTASVSCAEGLQRWLTPSTAAQVVQGPHAASASERVHALPPRGAGGQAQPARGPARPRVGHRADQLGHADRGAAPVGCWASAAPACSAGRRWTRWAVRQRPCQQLRLGWHMHMQVPGSPSPGWGRSLRCSCADQAGAAQVHKFSKFIHGSSVLLPDMVQAVPYWIDDQSVRKSIIQSSREQCAPASRCCCFWPACLHGNRRCSPGLTALPGVAGTSGLTQDQC